MEESVKIHTILNCFVDLNLETNEMFPYDVQILKVSFSSNYYVTEEASTLVITAYLDQPSTLGIEEATVIISNITTSNSDLDISGFPLRIAWEEGEQVKQISIPITRDFIEETDEAFLVGLTNLVNLLPGQYVQANVVVEDRTVLRTVRILAANTNSDTSPRLDPNARVFDNPIPDERLRNTSQTIQQRTIEQEPSGPFRTPVNDPQQRFSNAPEARTSSETDTARINQTVSFTLYEGESVNISVGLDQPSEYGVEKVDVVLFSTLSDGTEVATPLVALNAQRLEWSIGDQFKTVTVSAVATNEIEGGRVMILELRNPDSVKFNSSENHRVQIVVLDPPVDRRFATINFGDIYKQRGSIISGNDPEHDESEIELRRISDNQNTDTSTLYWLVELGTAYIDENNNPLVSESANYAAWPNYSFGLGSNGLPAYVSMRVTNRGEGDIIYNNVTYRNGQSFFVLLARDATTMVLPTNSGIRYAGDVLLPDNITLTANTYCEARYEFTLSVTLPQFQLTDGLGMSGPHGFQLKTTSMSSNLYPLGEFVLPNYRTTSLANANASALYSKYSNMRTKYNGSTCTNTFEGNGMVHDVRIKGLILLSRNSLNTDLISHEIGPDGNFNPICSSTAGNSGGMAWTSIPFEIV
jgi:hypothetical protein